MKVMKLITSARKCKTNDANAKLMSNAFPNEGCDNSF